MRPSVCLNGHEGLKRQLTKAGIKYEALDNGLLRCSGPQRAQALADSVSAAHIDALRPKLAALKSAGSPREISLAGACISRGEPAHSKTTLSLTRQLPCLPA